jgi:hypothetical protein
MHHVGASNTSNHNLYLCLDKIAPVDPSGVTKTKNCLDFHLNILNLYHEQILHNYRYLYLKGH